MLFALSDKLLSVVAYGETIVDDKFAERTDTNAYDFKVSLCQRQKISGLVA